MFDFLKKKKKQKETYSETELMLSEDKDDCNDKDATAIATGFVVNATVQNATTEANIKFETPSYNPKTRKTHYDDPKAHKHAIDKAFSSEQPPRDPYTGAQLVKKQRDAKTQYGPKWQNHAAEGDHIDPISQAVKRNQNKTIQDAFLTAEDYREVINRDSNFQAMSRTSNQQNKQTGKGGNTQEEWANDPTRMEGLAKLSESGESAESIQKRIREKGLVAERETDRLLFQKSVKNAAKFAHESGKTVAQDAAANTAAMSGILNLTAVIKGEKSVEDALVDTAADTGKAAASGYLTGAGIPTLNRILCNNSSKFLQALGESNVPGKIITAVIVTGDTLKRYASGEITTQECLIQLGEKGLNMATTGYSMAIGQALIPIPIVGAAVGALVGSMLTSNYYNQLMSTLRTKELEHFERLRIIEECERAAEQARIFRAEMVEYLSAYFREYQDCFDEALSTIHSAFATGDADGVISGANQITAKLGGNIHFTNMSQFKSYLSDDTVDIL